MLNKGSTTHSKPEPKKDELISDAGLNASASSILAARYENLGEISIPEDVIAIKVMEMKANL